ncbi:RagB/SusD family nutrient uptake outer membrane protein [Pontibacter toksunensis]|uniref:RagB/SusD family nutrient uptake outer membrane protein n=1 Tax=Pontibacter toksunensis TaxID=1332631 RepID=A0ABW6BVZ4_9BACT
MKSILKKISPLALAVLMLTSCEKEYLETAPTADVSIETVFQTTEGALVALNGTIRSMWTSMAGSHGHFGQKSYDLTMDLMGNDMVIHTQGYSWFTTEYNLTAQASAANNSRSDVAWEYYYRTINNANRIIAGLETASGTEEEKEYIRGNALALRAYSYFYLINLWQHTYVGNENAPGVPIYTEPTTEGKPRATVQEVYAQIISDLDAAEAMLEGQDRLHTSHVNTNVVQGIRARVALQMEDWTTAAAKANQARQGFGLMSAEEFQAGFGVDTEEWIWGLEIPNDQSTIFASFFSHFDASRLSYASLGLQKKITKELYDMIPEGDVRKTTFVTPGTGTGSGASVDYNQKKFYLPVAGSWAADYVLMRAAEMYLIEAEALARLGQNAEAQAVLNELLEARVVEGFEPVAATGQELINEILLQRRIELWGEGFSLLDLKRLNQDLNRPSGAGNHDAALAQVFQREIDAPEFLFRIPQAEIDANDALTVADQNPE